MPVATDAFYLIDHRLLAIVMVAVLLAACEIGYRLGLRRVDVPDSKRTLISGIGGAMFGLLGLLLGFALAMAISRWDVRRDVIIQEANAIGTLSLRAVLLEEPLRGQLQEAMRAYTEARVVLGGSRDQPDVLGKALNDSEDLHVVIWSVVERANQPNTSNAVLSSQINSANQVIDLHELRLSSLQNHLPATLFYMLVSLGAVSVGFIAWGFGAASSHRGRAPPILLAILIAAVLLLIMDVNRPQRGIIEVGVAPLERTAESIDELGK